MTIALSCVCTSTRTRSCVRLFTYSNASAKGQTLKEMTFNQCVTMCMKAIFDLNGPKGSQL